MPDFGMTVGDLKRLIKNFPDDAKVYYHRIEDVYFKKHGWDKTTIEIINGDVSFQGEYVWLQGLLFIKKKNILYLSAHY